MPLAILKKPTLTIKELKINSIKGSSGYKVTAVCVVLAKCPV